MEKIGEKTDLCSCRLCFMKFGSYEKRVRVAGMPWNYFLHPDCLKEQTITEGAKELLLRIAAIIRKQGYKILNKKDHEAVIMARRDHRIVNIAKGFFYKIEKLSAVLMAKSFQKFRRLVQATEKLIGEMAKMLHLTPFRFVSLPPTPRSMHRANISSARRPAYA